MKNDEISAAWAYHNGTKHSLQSIRVNRHYLDWQNQPLPFKIYRNIEPMRLPEQLSSSGIPALSALSGSTSDEGRSLLTRQSLAEILFLSAGITRRRTYPGGEMLFRAAACTGALYHIDLYIVGALEDLAAGVYQFSPQDFALRKLRDGDFRSVLIQVSGEEPSIATAPCVVVCASTFWRNAWKYQSRAYRHCFWDTGTIVANLLAAASAREILANVVAGFVDTAVSRLLGLDAAREAPIALVALGNTAHPATEAAVFVAPLHIETEPLSATEVDYPAMRRMHEASELQSAAEVKAWRDQTTEAQAKRDGQPIGRSFMLHPLDAAALPNDTVEDVIVRRGSTRAFAREPITFEQLSIVLERATGALSTDFLTGSQPSLNDIYLIVHAVTELPSGAYFFQRDQRVLELFKEGDFRQEAGHLGLGQEIPADCSVNIYFLADLDRALARFGNRGYRAAQLEAGIIGGKIYLAAYAQRLGASGLTFFDDDVTEFFSPHAAGKSVMFLVALGKSAKKRIG
ncbi:MAG TPA: SagB/ThcOx family dehydrogenase [Candidatus Binatia bacterium]|nr:SagB/ThcOx family dehydrogenase [Candidatus Binatia bacterium]